MASALQEATIARFEMILTEINRAEFELLAELHEANATRLDQSISGLMLRELLREALAMLADNLGKQFSPGERARIRAIASEVAREIVTIVNLHE